MKQKKKWITLKKERNGIRVKTSTNITGVDVIEMMTKVLCKILSDVARLNSLNITAEELSERYKQYMKEYLSRIMKEKGEYKNE